MLPIFVFGALALVAWMHQPVPEPAPAPKVVQAAPDRVVLLPNADGTAGAIVILSAAGERRIDQAYLSAEVQRNGAIEMRKTDPAEVQQRYGDALAAQPRAPVSFSVSFRSGSEELTPESLPVLDKLRAELAQRAVPEIVVIGHTDRVGRTEANDALSLRRAAAVKALLVKGGIPEAQIEAAGRGEREPLYPTADEVAEPRNRRVEISVR